MIKEEFEKILSSKCCTLLGVGPMSINCVDAVLELGNENNIPLMLIASRRQIDSEYFGGGYVNNWSTEKFANYVYEKDINKKVVLCRDHGGPWQNNQEVANKISLKEAMASAKKSFESDILSGFKIIHIDPSIDIFEKPILSNVLDRLFELYEYCFELAKNKNKEILFEIGTEEQSGSTNTQEELEYTLSEVYKFCKKNKFPYPSFVVIQSGTRVMETRNIGSFDSPFRIANELPPEIQIPKMIEICKKFKIMMKAHNTDYLSNEALAWYPRLGIHSANIAPEFGVEESKAFVSILRENNLSNLAEMFLEISYKSMKWKKWIINEELVDDEKKGIICGHYNFSKKDFLDLKSKALFELKIKGIDLDKALKNHVKKIIKRYLTSFRLI